MRYVTKARVFFCFQSQSRALCCVTCEWNICVNRFSCIKSVYTIHASFVWRNAQWGTYESVYLPMYSIKNKNNSGIFRMTAADFGCGICEEPTRVFTHFGIFYSYLVHCHRNHWKHIVVHNKGAVYTAQTFYCNCAPIFGRRNLNAECWMAVKAVMGADGSCSENYNIDIDATKMPSIVIIIT